MKRFAIPLILVASLVAGVAFAQTTAALGEADGAASVDAGPATAAPAATPAATAPTPAAPVLTDPVKEPAKAVTVVKDAYEKTGLVVAAVLALAMIASALSSRAKPGSFLDRGKLPVILAGAAGVLGAAVMALNHEIPWSAVLAALATAGAAVVNPDPPLKPKA